MTSQNPPKGALRKAVSWLREARWRTGRAVAGFSAREETRAVWFHRGYRTVTGGSIKHSHYFEHVLRMPGFAPKVALVGEPANEAYARTLQQLWPARDHAVVARWEPGPRDVLFVEGVDWRFLAKSGLETLAIPRINLIQGIQHVHEGSERYGYLVERAIRVCVSQEVADAIAATGRTRGPILTVPNGTDVTPFEPAGQGSPAGYGDRHFAVTILGYKSPDLAAALSERLHSEGIDALLLSRFLDRSTYLGLLAESRVAVCLPYAEEGFYLPALEAVMPHLAALDSAAVAETVFQQSFAELQERVQFPRATTANFGALPCLISALSARHAVARVGDYDFQSVFEVALGERGSRSDATERRARPLTCRAPRQLRGWNRGPQC